MFNDLTSALPTDPLPMALNIPTIANTLNELSRSHPIGALQAIRTKLKHLKRRPGKNLFSVQTTFREWAFHHGGRTELQFNIGYVDPAINDDLRYGVAFSFELSQTLRSLNVLVPKVKFFNDFMESNAEDFSDMRMWHYEGQRSTDQPAGLIPSALVREGVFVFLGKRQSATAIDYERILNDFDRLLPLFQYIESRGATAPLPYENTVFSFEPGFSQKVVRATATLAQLQLDLDLRHNHLQDALYRQLVVRYGKHNVRTEQPSGVGTQIDVVVKRKNEYWFYEIKTALTARACLREAIGQLLEYSFWPGAQEPSRFIVVGESPIDDDGKKYLRRLRNRFALRIEYESTVV
jgi:hypothetical protein